MRNRGVVKRGGKICEVAVVRQSACGENCATCGGCTVSETLVSAQNDVGAKEGDRVLLEIADKAALSAAKTVYLLPIILLLIAVVIGYFLKINENGIILLALLSLAVSFTAIWLYSKHCKDKFIVKVIEILK